MADQELSKNSEAVKTAYDKGYEITESGEAINPDGEELVLTEDGGYMRFKIFFNGQSYPVMVHRLQAYQKFGDRVFNNEMQVRHLDDDKRNNSCDNIGIGTQSQNMMDMPEEKRKRGGANYEEMSKKEKKEWVPNNKKLTEEAVKEIRKKVSTNNYSTYKKLAKQYGLQSAGNISDIVNRRTWTHI